MDKLRLLLGRLAERSTVVGLLAGCVLATGYAVAPERIDAIATVTSTLASLALVLVKEER